MINERKLKKLITKRRDYYIHNLEKVINPVLKDYETKLRVTDGFLEEEYKKVFKGEMK